LHPERHLDDVLDRTTARLHAAPHIGEHEGALLLDARRKRLGLWIDAPKESGHDDIADARSVRDRALVGEFVDIDAAAHRVLPSFAGWIMAQLTARPQG